MRCPACTNELPNDAQFCPSCGRRLAVAEAAAPLVAAYQRALSEGVCPKCGSTEIYADDRGLADATGGITVLNLHDLWHGSTAPISTYLCATCGYLELFLADTRLIAEIAQRWRRVG